MSPLEQKGADAAESQQVLQSTAMLFDEKYYQTGLGLPYDRNEYWLGFFGGIAEHIIRSLNPHRVFDAGCAMGMLVEAFWDRGVECWGMDISPYAIQRVRSDIRSYCRQGSISEPISGEYDLVTCIEVLEHLSESDARNAAANLTRVTDRILFSSTPDDLSEPTHFTVRPPIYWLKLFADLGFWPELEYDASYITQHAILFRRRPEGLPLEALSLLARNLKFRGALVQQSVELNRHRRERSETETRIQELVAARNDLGTNIEKLKQEMAQSQQERAQLESDLSAAEEVHKQSEAKLNSELNRLRRDFEVRLQGLERVRDNLESELSRLREESAAEIQRIAGARESLQSELTGIVSSPGWKIISGYRKWFGRQMEKRSLLVRLYEPAARWYLHRNTQGALLPLPHGEPQSDGGPSIARSDDPAATEDITYETWIRENEPDQAGLLRQRDDARALDYRPLLSVIVPVYRVDHRFLRECIESVLHQTYDNWEICIVNACPEADENRSFLSRTAAQDGRVKLLQLDENRGISENSNAAIAMAEGEFVVLLDHDDSLAPFALYEVASRLSEERELDVLYSDHDYVDESSRRFAPLFKPDWSPDTLLSANYVTHLTVVRRTLFGELGGFDPEVDSAQDWDFFFRVTRKTQRVGHLAKVLYHWRKHASSTALTTYDSGTTKAQLLSIQRHLDALAWPADAATGDHDVIHIRWRETPKSKVSIIIPSKDKMELLSRCIHTVLSTTSDEDVEILIVDNGSTETQTMEYYASLESDARIRVLEFNERFNYSAMNNFGAANASGEFFLFLNNDTEAIHAGWLRELIGWAQLKDIGAVGAKLLRPNGTIQHAGVVVGFGGFAGHPYTDQVEYTSGFFGTTEWYRDYLAVTGACMAMRREVFEQIGGFDEQFISCGSDVEICLRMRSAGYRVVYNPFARLLHHECATRKGAVPDADFTTSFRHYRTYLEQGDPYWNRNLSPWKSSIALRHSREQVPLEVARRVIQGLTPAQSASTQNAAVRAQPDEELFVKWFDFSDEDVGRSKQAGAEVRGHHTVRRLVWFIPDFQNPYYGGICTILRFADYLRRSKGVSSHYAVWGSADAAAILRRIRVVDPGCSPAELTVFGIHDELKVPESDACIATLWATAFPALKYQRTKRKFYFVQDYEPLFYRAGSGSGLAESTYRFGFYGIANTVSLKSSYEVESGQKAIHFSPCIDTQVFFPPEPRLQRLKNVRSYRQLFVYARPNHPRNAFELVAAALRNVKERLSDRVRIVCAGDEWQAKDHGLDGIIENLGILDYRRTAQVYRESDAGVALMFTRHPSYIPFELMACGALVIANRNRWTEWLLKDGENCLLSEASATCLAETIARGLEQDEERTRITARAEAHIRDHYTDWGAQISRVYDFMCDPENVTDIDDA